MIMHLPDASSAKRAALKNKKKNLEKQAEEIELIIENTIQATIEKGECICVVPETKTAGDMAIIEDCATKLRKLGYVVDYVYPYQMRISWEKGNCHS